MPTHTLSLLVFMLSSIHDAPKTKEACQHVDPVWFLINRAKSTGSFADKCVWGRSMTAHEIRGRQKKCFQGGHADAQVPRRVPSEQVLRWFDSIGNWWCTCALQRTSIPLATFFLPPITSYQTSLLRPPAIKQLFRRKSCHSSPMTVHLFLYRLPAFSSVAV